MEVHVASIQMESVAFALRENLEVAERAVSLAASKGAQLILLPEFFHIGYCYDHKLRDYVEPVGGETTDWLVRMSRRTGAHVGGCIAEQEDHRLFDTFLLAAPSGDVHCYRKRHPAFFENLYFSRGHEEGIFDTAIGRIGVMICWDMVHPHLANAMADRVDCLIISAAWPDMNSGNWKIPLLQQWISRQPHRRPRQLATQLQVPTLFANLAGSFETRVPGLGVRYRSRFAGHSIIADGQGRTVATSTYGPAVVHGYLGHGKQATARAA